MAYIGNNNISKSISDVFIGSADGIATQVDKIYAGIDGLAKKVYPRTIVDPKDTMPGLRYRWPLTAESGLRNTAVQTVGTCNLPSGNINDANGLQNPAGNSIYVYNLNGLTNPITVSFWLRPQAYGTMCLFTLFNQSTGAGSTSRTLIYCYGGNTGIYQGSTSGYTTWSLKYNSSTFPAGTWKHLTFLIHPGVTMYYQGTAYSKIGPTGSATTTNPSGLLIGSSGVYSESLIYYKDFRIYNKHLTTAEIQQIYQEGI
jgi:hypothetical protein